MTKRRLINGMTLFFTFVAVLFIVTACGSTQKKFNLNFDAAGVVTVVQATAKKEVSLPEDPVRNGYSFEGWYLDKDLWINPFTKDTVREKEIKEETTIYAKFEIVEYTIKYFNAKGAKFEKVESYNVESETIELAIISANGYDFVGWSDGTNIITSIPTGSFGNKVLTAVWDDEAYDITYNGVEGAINNNPSTYTIRDEVVLVDPEKDGYTFTGWSSSTGAAASISAGSAGEVSFTASWEIIEYSITYGNLEGTTQTNVDKYNVESENIILANPTERRGYTFMGWSDGTSIIASIPTGSFGNKTLTAVWEINTYTITYNNLYGVAHSNPSTYTVGDVITLTKPAERLGYSFDGWSDGTSIITTIPVGSINNVVLTATWTTDVLTIAYDNTKLIVSISDVITPELFSATCTNRDGKSIDVTASIVGGEFEAGKTISVRLYSEYNTITDEVIIEDIKVYGTPTFNGIRSEYVYLDNDLSLIFDVVDSFGGTPTVTYTTTSDTWQTEDTVTINAIATDVAGNTSASTATVNVIKKKHKDLYEYNSYRLSGFKEGVELTDNVIISYENNGVLVTLIQDYSFRVLSTDVNYEANLNIKSVYMPHSIEAVGISAFQKCSNLSTVRFSNNLLRIGTAAFSETALVEAIIPEGVSLLSSEVFRNCVSLVEVSIPDSVKTLGNSMLRGCTSLEILKISKNVTVIPAYFCEGNTLLDNVVIPEGVTVLGENSFYGCTSLENLVIPSTIVEFGNDALYNTAWLNNISSRNGLIYIGKIAFKYVGTMPENTTITLAEGTVNISAGAFQNYTNLVGINIPNSVVSIGDKAFSGSGIKSVIIPNDCTTIGVEAFYDCISLANVTLPNNLTSMGTYAFRNCSALEKITIPSSLTLIPTRAFESCSSLTTLVVSEGVISIDNNAFYNCTKLENITMPDSVRWINSDVFTGTKWLENQADGLVYIGKVAYKYKGTFSGGELVLREDTVGIAGSAFLNLTSMTSITIPSTVKSIAAYAFQGCTGLTEIFIPSSVTRIGYIVFDGCTKLNIYCEATGKPSEWHNSWIGSGYKSISWGQSGLPTTEE